MKLKLPSRAIFGLLIAAAALGAQAFGVDLQAFSAQHADVVAGLSLLCVGDITLVMKSLDKLELNLKTMSEKAEGEMKTLGKVSEDTKTAIDALGTTQRELADRLLQIEQKQGAPKDDTPVDASAGAQFIKSASYDVFHKAEARGKVRFQVKNTVTNAIANTFSERRPGIVEGAFRVFTIEDLLTSIPTTSNAIDWIQENVFTNAAAETAEGAQKPQSSITFTPKTMPISTVAHWIKITRQLAMDNAALAAYINRRMIYGVNMRVESQLVAGNGTTPNLNGLTNTGNFTPHGYTAASLTALGLTNNRFDLIGKMMGDAALADYPADVVILNTGDWWTMRLAKDSQGRYLLGDPGSTVAPSLFGRPVVASNAMTADNVWVGSLSQAATLHNREPVSIEMSESDENNFQLNLITIRAERRLALTVEKPAAARYGDLTPA
jgi:HK97 family phage major capsid protein